MGDTKIAELTVETFQKLRPDLHEAIFEAGKKYELKRFMELQKSCGNDFELLAESFVENRESEETLRKRVYKAESRSRKLSVDENLLRHEFGQDPALQDEFHDVKSYIAFKKNEVQREQAKADRKFKN